jgi:hypothetical protein
MDPKTLQFIIPVLIILPILYLRLTRMMKPQRLKLQNLLIRPAIIIFVAAVVLSQAPPRQEDLVWYALAVALGAGGGWYWGKLTQLHLHPEDGTLMSSGSQAGMIVLVLLILVRYGVRAGIGLEAQTMHLNAVMLTDLLIVFTAALFSVRGLEIFLRARQMMKSPNP